MPKSGVDMNEGKEELNHAEKETKLKRNEENIIVGVPRHHVG